MKNKILVVLCSVLLSVTFVMPSAAFAEEPKASETKSLVGTEVRFGYKDNNIAESIKWEVMEQKDDYYVLLSTYSIAERAFQRERGSSSKYANGSDMFRWLNDTSRGGFAHYFSGIERTFLKGMPTDSKGGHTVSFSIPTEEEVMRWFPAPLKRKTRFSEDQVFNNGTPMGYWILTAVDLEKGIDLGTQGTIIDRDGNKANENRSNRSTYGVRVKIMVKKDFLDGYGETGVYTYSSNTRFLETGRSGVAYNISDEMLNIAYSIFLLKPKGKMVQNEWEIEKTHYDSTGSKHTFTGALYRRDLEGGKMDYCFVFRGSETPQDWQADFDEIFNGNCGDYLHAAIAWVNENLKTVIIPKIDNIENIYFTGHSLGSYIANHTAANVIEISKINIDYPILTAISQNGPEAALEMLQDSMPKPEPIEPEPVMPEPEPIEPEPVVPEGEQVEPETAVQENEPTEPEPVVPEEEPAEPETVEPEPEVNPVAPASEDAFSGSLVQGPRFERFKQYFEAFQNGTLSAQEFKKIIKGGINNYLKMNASPDFKEAFGTDPTLETLETITAYRDEVVPRLHCYGFSTPGCTPLPMQADPIIQAHFDNSEKGMYDKYIRNYYINGDFISQFGSHLGKAYSFNSSFTSFNPIDYHAIEGLYYFKPLEYWYPPLK